MAAKKKWKMIRARPFMRELAGSMLACMRKTAVGYTNSKPDHDPGARSLFYWNDARPSRSIAAFQTARSLFLVRLPVYVALGEVRKLLQRIESPRGRSCERPALWGEADPAAAACESLHSRLWTVE